MKNPPVIVGIGKGVTLLHCLHAFFQVHDIFRVFQEHFVKSAAVLNIFTYHQNSLMTIK